MVLQSDLKEFLRFHDLASIAMNFSQLVSGIGVAWIDFQLLHELLRRSGYIIRRVALPGTRQQGPAYPIVNPRPPGIHRKHLAVFADGCIIGSLAFVGLGLSLMPPDRTWSHLRQL